MTYVNVKKVAIILLHVRAYPIVHQHQLVPKEPVHWSNPRTIRRNTTALDVLHVAFANKRYPSLSLRFTYCSANLTPWSLSRNVCAALTHPTNLIAAQNYEAMKIQGLPNGTRRRISSMRCVN